MCESKAGEARTKGHQVYLTMRSAARLSCSISLVMEVPSPIWAVGTLRASKNLWTSMAAIHAFC